MGVTGGNPKLILIKHAQPEVVESISSHQWRLSEQGRSDAAELANAIAPHTPQVVVTSDEPKAVETGRILAQTLDLPCEQMPGLQENDRTGLPYLCDEEYAATFRRFFERPDELVVGRETAQQAGDRFVSALERVVDAYPDRTIAVVAHGTVISLWLQRTVGIDPFILWQRLGLPSYTVLALPDLRLERVADYLDI